MRKNGYIFKDLFLRCATLIAFAFSSAAHSADPVAAQPQFSTATAFDVSPPVSALPQVARTLLAPAANEAVEIRLDPSLVEMPDLGFLGDGAIQESPRTRRAAGAPAIPAPNLTFEGLSNEDNRNFVGFRVLPPDPVGDVGPNHYVEMTNLVFAVYDKQGNLLAGPARVGDLWAGFAVPDCDDDSGDPIVLYDQFEDRWILTQFTTAGFGQPNPVFYNCVAISQTGDPTGAYFRYAFPSGAFFPDYPKYGVWTNSYLLTSRDFEIPPPFSYGISVYALEKRRMIAGDPNARSVKFLLEIPPEGDVPLPLVGDGLLPADIDGDELPDDDVPAPIIGTQDDGFPYGATFDALNVFELSVKWRANPVASLTLAAQLPVAPFDSVFPCAPSPRDCLPQPGVTDPTRFLDVQSYRQRAIHRLAYRSFDDYEAMVTNQSVEARPGLAGVRWYEVRRDEDGRFSVHQQGTYAPDDGVNRWMGSIAMDRKGNMALGYSVTNSTDVFPGIRYTGRLRRDTPGEMTLGEGVVIEGTGAQLATSSRWGDYTSMNVDPTDDCTFWYVNEYYAITEVAAFQTRVASITFPGCDDDDDDDDDDGDDDDNDDDDEDDDDD